MLNSVLYNWKEGINNEVKKRQGKSAAAIAPRPSIGDNVSATIMMPCLTEKLTSLQKG